MSRFLFLFFAGLVVLLGVVTLNDLPSRAAREILPAYLELADCPDDPGCPALILSDITEFNHNLRRPKYTRRQLIKFFTPEGVQTYSDISAVEMASGWDVKNMWGRTILPDGSEISLGNENISTKTFRDGKLKYRVKSANFPNVVPGALIEWNYEYEMELINFKRYDIWEIQKDIPVLKTIYILKPGNTTYGWVQAGMEQVDIEVKKPEEKTWVFTANRVPPVPSEPMGPHPRALQSRMYFFHPGLQKNWLEDASRDIARWSGVFIEETPTLREKANELAPPSDSDADRAQKIYHFIQTEIRTEADYLKGPEGVDIEDARSAEDVLTRGFGNEMERTLLFLALARAANLDASFLLLSSRYNGRLYETVPDFEFFDSFAASIKLTRGWRTIDPATPYCPFGMVSAEKESAESNGIMVIPFFTENGRIVNSEKNILPMSTPFSIIGIPITPARINLIKRDATVTLLEDGTGEVEFVETGTGQAGLSHRNTFGPLGAEERRQELQNLMEGIIPGVEVIEASFENITSIQQEAKIRGRMTVPEIANRLGDRLVLSPSIFHLVESHPFTAESRKSPVYLPYARGSEERILVKIPAGFRIETLPEPVAIDDPPLTFTLSFFETPEGLRIHRRLDVDAAVFPVEEYDRLRSFFGKVRAADSRALILPGRAE